MRKRNDDNFDFDSEEGAVLFDVESNPKYENANPGTVTVEGFGLEAWDFEETHYPKEQTVFVNYSDPGDIPARKLLRRIDELQRGPGKLGWNPNRDHADLKEFTGDMGITYSHPSYEYEDRTQFSNLFSFLNRTDIFANFLSTSSVGAEWNDPRRNGSGFWNLLWQVIIAKELIRRFESNSKDSYTSGFTGRVLASMIIADLWIKNVEIVLTEMKIPPKDIKPPETEDLKAKAEDFKKKGNDALAKKEYEKAIELYTEAIKIDSSSAVYRANRSAACYSLERYQDSLEDAYIAIRLDVKYAKAWSRYGLAAVKLGWTKKAVEAYENAIALAGKDATASMRQGLTDAKAANTAKLKAIENEPDKEKQDVLRKEFIDQDFEIMLKCVEVHSRCHGQQVEGLILFAERMKWPWINDVRDYAEEAYSNLRGGQFTPMHLHDWLFGMTLPGQWFSFKIMTALITCTPSMNETIAGIAPYYDCGLSLPKKSYWRVRTVLGRVLGCLPSVTSLCGWLGPCPPVEFLKTGRDDEGDFDSSKPRHIKLKARRVTPVEHKGWSDDATIFIGDSGDRYEDTRLRDDEELEPWMAEMKDQSNWIVPEPPVRQVSTCNLTKIQLKRDLSATDAATDPDAKAVYRAQLTFTLDDNPTGPITYKLHTNPVFVTPPPCHPGPRGPHHEVHLRELHRYQERNIWTIERLKEHTAEDDPERGGVMVINATGQGAEALARAWCSERGKNAVIRRAGGPCFVCAERAASRCGLGTRVLIWVS
jgi:tetratricopeptide (TPR) repeat protein